ncbi:MAG: hypothetical protein K5695_14370 [Oscillospiraceae bacterium]|nr:hypothetical protein [Oscillospiraceae bacterium]
MPFVSAICPSCGGKLEVDGGKEAGICTFCGNPFITEKAINNYHIQYHIHADNVISYGGKPSMEELLEKEAVYLRLHEQVKLAAVYEEMTDSYPSRYEGWWGKIRILTENFTDPDADMEQVGTWYGFVQEAADAAALPELKRTMHDYRQLRLRHQQEAEIEAQRRAVDEAQKSLTDYRERMDTAMSGLQERITERENAIRKTYQPNVTKETLPAVLWFAGAVACLVGAVAGFWFLIMFTIILCVLGIIYLTRKNRLQAVRALQEEEKRLSEDKERLLRKRNEMQTECSQMEQIVRIEQQKLTKLEAEQKAMNRE